MALLLVAVSVAVLPRHASPFALPKRLVGETLALVSLACLWPAFLLAGPASRLWRSRAFRAVLPLVAVAWASLAWSRHPELTRDAALSLLIGAACWVVWSEVLEKERLERLLVLLVVLGVGQAAFAITQYHGWFSLLELESVGSIRVGLTGLVGAVGDLGAYLVMPLLIAQWRWNARSQGRRGVRWLVAIGVLGYGLLVTGSLTGLVAVAAGSLMFWWRPNRRRRVLAVAGSLVLALALGAAASEPLQKQLASKMASVREGDWNGLLTGRVDGWKVAVAMWRSAPWSGVGWGVYRAEFGSTKLGLAAEGVSFYPAHVYPAFQNAHDEPLEVMAEGGLLALGALLWAAGLVALSWLRIEDLDDRALARSGLVAVGLDSLAHFPFRLAVTAFPIVVFLSWVVRTAREERP